MRERTLVKFYKLIWTCDSCKRYFSERQVDNICLCGEKLQESECYEEKEMEVEFVLEREN